MENYYEKLYLRILDDFEKNYSYLSFKEVKISDLRAESVKFKDIKSDAEFVEALKGELFKFEDLHVGIWLNGKKKDWFKRKTAKNYDLTVLENFLGRCDFDNEIVKIKRINNALYVFVKSWGKDQGNNLMQANGYFLCTLRQGGFDKVIFDVRANGGGNSDYAKAFAELLVEKGKKVEFMKKKVSSVDLKPFNGTIEPMFIEGKGEYLGKVILLIGSDSVSSSEMFALMLKESGATLIGDRTYGASGNPQTFDYGSVQVGIPRWVSYKVNSEMLEGAGIEPDIKIPAEKSIVNGRDLVLEKALEL